MSRLLKTSRQMTKKKVIPNECIRTASTNSEDIKNPFGVLLVAPKLHNKLFKTPYKKCTDPDKITKAEDHLKRFQILTEQSSSQRNEIIDGFQIPPIHKNDIVAHFKEIGQQQIQPFLQQIEILLKKPAPPKPSNWVKKAGWTKYEENGTYKSVRFPEEDILVFDIEICVAEARWPAMATALSPTGWYSWTSEYLLDPSKRPAVNIQALGPSDLIPLGDPLLVIGHNVSFDRSFIAEQYDIKPRRTRFLDTMALHIAVSGVTMEQRAQLMAAKSRKKNNSEDEALPKWMENASMNSLRDLHQFYNKGAPVMDKDIRNVFVNGTLKDVVDDFTNLMQYCADDVDATFQVFRQVFPKFRKQCPHPVSLSGMLEMSVSYLPTNSSWFHFIKECENVSEELDDEIDVIIARQAQEACQLLENQEYRKDIWLWNLDWTCTDLKIRKTATKMKKASLKTEFSGGGDTELEKLEQKFWPLLKTKDLHKSQSSCPGYPKWYADLCQKPYDPMVTPTVANLGHGKEIVPRLLRLTWNGYPLHKDKTMKWGYIVPNPTGPNETEELQDLVKGSEDGDFPVESLWSRIPQVTKKDTVMEENPKEIKVRDSTVKSNRKPLKAVKSESGHDIDIPGVLFFPIPHKDGKERVGNPLSKGLLERFEDGTLSTDYDGGQFGGKVLKYSKMMSYWRSNRDRICNQMVVKVDNKDNYAILPQIVTAGTLTRRAVEKTWLTASNARPDRIGSELKAMIRACDNYTFVGADVDSQELWIAAILGDAYFVKEHGCTALGWRTLQGSKAQGTDMHSVTAKLAGVSRDQAKILNYARIYGAGKLFAKSLLMQFNSDLKDRDALAAATKTFIDTKGEKIYKLNSFGILCNKIAFDDDNDEIPSKSLKKCSRVREFLNKTVESDFDPYATHFQLKDGVTFDSDSNSASVDDLKREFRMYEEKKRNEGRFTKSIYEARKDDAEIVEKTYWKGGSESYTFNHLEALALAWKAKTPVLGCAISEALTSENVGTDYLPSRINWVVQSSAVDYLHLLLSAMKWLINEYDIEARFAISIHDEVRYLVSNEDAYRSALALQVANLMVRAIFCKRLGMNSMPLDVAYFSGVDIDMVMRKEPFADCVTPSNPQGLTRGYGVPVGQCLTMIDILKETDGRFEKT